LAAENMLDLTGITGSGPGGRIILEDVERVLGSPPAVPEKKAPRGRIKASPAARRLAAENNLALEGIAGSGPGGRIVLEDIERILESPPAVSESSAGEESAAVRAPIENEVSESIPIAGVRRVIFDNMFLSLSRSAQLTLHTDASAEPMVDLREEFRANGIKISYNAILIKACATALRRHPAINATVEGNSIQVWEKIHVGLAMEAGENLVVPVVRSPDLKPLPQIETDLAALAAKVQENRLTPDELSGGTFTVSNLGFTGVDHFTPIIRPPESAVLGVGRIAKKIVSSGHRTFSEPRIGLSLTFDHRIIDGAPAGRFLETIAEILEKPALMFF
jgi:pyruvate/2-oxoglutarate dehydrogenase complex dihydrolipoamide acyltransferase (E2) component